MQFCQRIHIFNLLYAVVIKCEVLKVGQRVKSFYYLYVVE